MLSDSRRRRHVSPLAVSNSKRLRIDYIDVSQLKLNRDNPRRHDRAQLARLVHSIQAFGFVVPVLINSSHELICGHGRVLAAKEIGLIEVPAIQLERLSEAQARALMIADNRLTELSSWDDRLLAEQFRLLDSLDLEFGLEVTGFDIAEIDLRLSSAGELSVDEPDPADTLPDQVSKTPVTKRGDVWVAGRHRIMCGNALDSAAYVALMDESLAAMMFADPPYNVPIEGHASGLGKVHHGEFAMASGEMTPAEFTRFLLDFSALAIRHSVRGAIHFVCIDWRHLSELTLVAKQAYSETKNVCIWVKHNAGMGSFYRSQHELVFVLKNGRHPHRNNIQLGKHGRNRTNVWSYRGLNDFGRGTDEGNLLKLHPTVKPVALIADAILDCSTRAEIILDPFLGSGSTVIAAERTGRRCYGLEIDPLYVDTALRRWQAFTGDNAVLAGTNETFSGLEAKQGRNNGQAE